MSQLYEPEKKGRPQMVVERCLCIDNARGIDPQVERSVKTMNRARNTQATLKTQIDVDIFKINT